MNPNGSRTRVRARANRQAAEIKSKDKWFKARVPAKVVGDIEKVEGSYTVELNIGSDQSVYCEIMPEGFDMADMVRRKLEHHDGTGGGSPGQGRSFAVSNPSMPESSATCPIYRHSGSIA